MSAHHAYKCCGFSVQFHAGTCYSSWWNIFSKALLIPTVCRYLLALCLDVMKSSAFPPFPLLHMRRFFVKCNFAMCSSRLTLSDEFFYAFDVTYACVFVIVHRSSGAASRTAGGDQCNAKLGRIVVDRMQLRRRKFDYRLPRGTVD